jgi:hypothetical protein
MVWLTTLNALSVERDGATATSGIRQVALDQMHRSSGRFTGFCYCIYQGILFYLAR